MADLCSGIDHGGWHRLRHTAATRLVEAGARPDQVQRQFGHHDLAFTMRTYVHPDEDDLLDPDAVWDEQAADDKPETVEAADGEQQVAKLAALPR